MVSVKEFIATQPNQIQQENQAVINALRLTALAHDEPLMESFNCFMLGIWNREFGLFQAQEWALSWILAMGEEEFLELFLRYR